MMPRTIAWLSGGAASAVAAKLSGGLPVYCETGSEHPDNERFLRDCEAWIGQPITRLKSAEYEDNWDLWTRRRYMAGINGAICTRVFKIEPRLAFQRPDDVHVFGYTADARDVKRVEQLRSNYFELDIRTPLIERGITKAACRALLESAGIQEPATYALGFPNANCVRSGCVKAQSPDYWALHRQCQPDGFARTAAIARDLGVRLARIKGERVYIDDIPANWPVLNPEAPACDFLCHLAEAELEVG